MIIIIGAGFWEDSGYKNDNTIKKLRLENISVSYLYPPSQLASISNEVLWAE
jgi:hypothetical protein